MIDQAESFDHDHLDGPAETPLLCMESATPPHTSNFWEEGTDSPPAYTSTAKPLQISASLIKERRDNVRPNLGRIESHFPVPAYQVLSDHAIIADLICSRFFLIQIFQLASIQQRILSAMGWVRPPSALALRELRRPLCRSIWRMNSLAW